MQSESTEASKQVIQRINIQRTAPYSSVRARASISLPTRGLYNVDDSIRRSEASF